MPKVPDRGEDADDGEGREVRPSGDCARLGESPPRWYCGSRVQNPPLPGSSFERATLMKHLFKDRL